MNRQWSGLAALWPILAVAGSVDATVLSNDEGGVAWALDRFVERG